MMTTLGACGSLSASTFIAVNELTTIASVEALSPFMASFANVGSDASNVAALTQAFQSATSMVNPTSGTLVPAAPGVTGPDALLNTLADILASCINTAGGTPGDATNCGKLFAYTGISSQPNTISAALSIAQLPSQNVAQLVTLAAPTSPFQPTLSATPPSFAVSTTIPLPAHSGANLIAIDTMQHIWVYLSFGQATGEIAAYDTSGVQLFTIQPGVGGLQKPVAMQADALGNVWTWNGNGTLSTFNASGAAISPPSGYVTAYTYPANGSPAMTIDPAGDVWLAQVVPGVVNACMSEYSNQGALVKTITGSNCPTALNSSAPESLTFASSDGSGDIFVGGLSNQQFYASELANSGSPLSAQPGYQAAGITTGFPIYDRKYNQLWVEQDYTASRFALFAANGRVISPPGGFLANPLLDVYSVGKAAIDGSGNLWFLTQSAPAKLGGFLSVLDHSGTQLSPSANYPDQSGYHLSVNVYYQDPIAIDAYGNIWIADTNPLTTSLIKVSGFATGKNYQ